MGSERVAHPWLPPGFRFHPIDEELVTCYLAKKMQDEAFMDPAIAEVDLHKCEPWDLPGMAKIGEREWYFYSFLDRKSPTGLRANGATEAGYWKATGKDKEVVSSRTNRLVGMKKTLVFYKGRAPKGQKTNWVMHEYRLVEPNIFARTSLAKEELVVCIIFQKNMAMVAPSPSSSSSLPPLMDSTQPLFSKPESIMTSTLESHPNIKHLEVIDSSLNCFSPNIVLKSFINDDVKQVDIIGQTRPLHNYGNLLDDIFNNYHFNGGLKQEDIQKSISTHLVSEEENDNYHVYSNRLLPNNASDLNLCNLWKY